MGNKPCIYSVIKILFLDTSARVMKRFSRNTMTLDLQRLTVSFRSPWDGLTQCCWWRAIMTQWHETASWHQSPVFLDRNCYYSSWLLNTWRNPNFQYNSKYERLQAFQRQTSYERTIIHTHGMHVHNALSNIHNYHINSYWRWYISHFFKCKL